MIFLKLNHDCVRDFLLYFEENIDLDESMEPEDFEVFKNIKNKYTYNEIIYTIQKLDEAGYIDTKTYMSGIEVFSITWNGHEFLDNIRSDTTWSETKSKILNNVGTTSLTIFSQVSAAIIKSKLGL